MIFYITQFLGFYFIGLLLYSLSSRKYIKYLISAIFSILCTHQLLSIYYMDSFLNFESYFHFNLRDFHAMIPEKKHLRNGIIIIANTLFFGFLIFLLNNFLYKKLNKIIRLNILQIKYKLTALVVITLYCSIQDGSVYNFYKTFIIQFPNYSNFNESLDRLGIDTLEYIKPSEIIANKGKNIIVISIESLERGFLEKESFNKYLPFIKEFKKNHSYFKMNQGQGSRLTITSLYTFITGVPMIFSFNTFWKLEGKSSKISSLGNVLHSANYNQVYISGENSEFGAKKQILNMNNIKSIELKDFKTTHHKILELNVVQDKDILSKAKEQLKLLSEKSNPFALYISTISTHAPNCFPDSRMKKYFPINIERIELCLSSIDYLIGDFFNYMDSLNLIDNTVLYIFPDHKIMRPIFEFENRGLFLLTTADKNDLRIDNDNILEQIDLAKLILEGAKVEHNVKFLTDFIKENKSNFIRENSFSISHLNKSSINK